MKKQLIAHNRIPYGSEWRYVEPSTGQLITGPTWTILINNIRAYRNANSIPIGLGFEDEVEKYLCEHQPSECEEVADGKPRKRSMTLADVVLGTKVMFSHWWNKRQLVSRQEAETRAGKCVNCPHNIKFAKSCSGLCPELSEVVSAITQHQGTSFDWQLHQCDICGCFLQSAIWMDLESQLAPLSSDQKQAFTNVPNCWKVPTA